MRNNSDATQGEITQLQRAILSEQNVIWLQVPMHHTMPMAVSDRLQQLQHDALYLLEWQSHAGLVYPTHQGESGWRHNYAVLLKVLFEIVFLVIVYNLHELVADLALLDFVKINVIEGFQVRDLAEDTRREPIVLPSVCHVQVYFP